MCIYFYEDILRDACVLVRRLNVSKRESLWEAYLAKGMSRRNFLKGCVTLTSLMNYQDRKSVV